MPTQATKVGLKLYASCRVYPGTGVSTGVQPRCVLFAHICLILVWEPTYPASHTHAGRNIDGHHVPCHKPNLAHGCLVDRPPEVQVTD